MRNDYRASNEQIFNWLLGKNNDFNELTLENGILGYQGLKLDLSYYDLRNVFSSNNMLIHDLEILTAEDLFNIISLHQKEQEILSIEPMFYKILNEG